MPTTADKRTIFRKMHEAGCFVLPNPFDVGSAKALQHLGFKAVASTSAGFAWTIGKADNRVTLEEVLAHLAAISEAVDIPVNADFEGGFAHEAAKVGVNVARAVRSGVAGLSIEGLRLATRPSRFTTAALRSSGSRPRARRSTPTTLA